MNYKITLSKNTDEEVEIQINLTSHILTAQQTVIDIDTDSTVINISRHDNSLYQTFNLVHTTYVIVEQILIDNFWIIGDNNHWSKTIYEQTYRDHLADKPVTWELSKDLYNNVLFFNGSIVYHITKPIRGMFFK
jgi:hypothetical protein